MKYTVLVDASYDFQHDIVGIGVVLRATDKSGSKHGPIVRTYCESYEGIPSGVCEKFAIFRALEIASENGCSNVKVRSDYNYMRRTLRSDHAAGVGLDRGDLHGDILRLASTIPEVKFAYVARRKNNAAHTLARKAVRERSPSTRPDIVWG